MNIIKYLIGILLYMNCHCYLYLSLIVDNVDDCISKIEIIQNNNNKTYFNFIEKFGNQYLERCSPHYEEEFKNFQIIGIPKINNILYNIGEVIYLEVYSQGIVDGYMSVTVKINEYIIHNKFWNCTNCIGENIFDGEKYNLFPDNYPINNKYFYFYFTAHNFSELNYENVEIDNYFYSLSNKTIFNHSINYKKDKLELINFNNTENFRITNNNTLNINYTNYFFTIYFKNKFYGNLVGLNSNNLEINITNGTNFYINETKGLQYILSPIEKYNYSASLFLKIRAYNRYLNKSVSKEEDFHFYINLIGDNLKCLNKELNISLKNVYYYFAQILWKKN